MPAEANRAETLLAQLNQLLGSNGVLTAADDCSRYEHGWRYGHGKALAVARPSSTAELAAVMRLCSTLRVRVVPQGANTGLVAASTPDASGQMLVLSLERFNRTIEVDAKSRTALVDGGVLLSQLNEALAVHGLWFPIDLGADPQVGGMVATNTGGTRLLKYGDVRHNLLGVEVVLADGTILDALRGLRKDNTGLDAKQLFVGTSGVFGIVTRAVLQLAPLPRQQTAALIGCADGVAALALLEALEAGAGELLSAFEVISANALAAVFRHQPALRDPFRGNPPPFAALIELSSTLPADKLDLDRALEATLADIATDLGDRIPEILLGNGADFWAIRHRTSESLRSEGRMLAFDISVPRSSLPDFTAAVAALLSRDHPYIRLCDYGHWGDGGTHLNLVWREADAAAAGHADFAALAAILQPAIYDLAVARFNGSYSAEHGIGPHNQAFYDRYTPATVRALCRTLQRHCDPQRLLGTVRLD